MDLQEDSPASPTNSNKIQNGDDESCVLIEEDLSIVSIADDDTIIEEPEICNLSSDNVDKTVEELIFDSDAIPSEFQIIDEVAGSQESEENGVAEEGEMNGVSFQFR
jgi:hypothetical protein